MPILAENRPNWDLPTLTWRRYLFESWWKLFSLNTSQKFNFCIFGTVLVPVTCTHVFFQIV